MKENTAEQSTTTNVNDKKSLKGTEQEKEKSALEKAATTIAGDNKLMETALKILLSPLTILLGVGAIIFCFFKIKNLSADIEILKAENKKLTEEKTEQEEEYHKLKKKYKKFKELNENENSLSSLGSIPKQLISNEPEKKKTYNTAFLD